VRVWMTMMMMSWEVIFGYVNMTHGFEVSAGIRGSLLRGIWKYCVVLRSLEGQWVAT
jgi:hypothetical protein